MGLLDRALRTLGLGDLAGTDWRRQFSFACLLGMAFFLFADQNLPSANLSRIGADFGFLDRETYLKKLGAEVALWFFLVGGAMSVVMGVLADRVDRKKLLLAAVVVGEMPCLLTAFAPSYPWYLAFRVLTGIGIGGVFPVLFSVLADYFRPANRSTATAWIGLAMGLGIGTGQVLGGLMADVSAFGMEGWRLSFLLVAVPAFPLALVYRALGTVPRRGEAEGVGETRVEEHAVGLSDLRKVFANRTNPLAYLQGLPGTVPWALLYVYFVDFYEISKGFTPQQASLLVACFGLAAIAGSFAGGFVGRKIYLSRPASLPTFCGLTVLAAAIPVFLLINYAGRSVAVAASMCVVGGFLATMSTPNLRAILMNTNLPEDRGAVFAVYNLTDDLGKGLGPFAVGVLIGWMEPLAAYNVAVSMWILCAAVWLFGIRFTVVTDEEAVREAIRGRSAGAGASPPDGRGSETAAAPSPLPG